MKRYIKQFILFSILLVCINDLQAQVTKLVTTQFHVQGVCDQCKARIENAAYIKGVKHCEWDIKSGILTITFNPSKIELHKIHENIAYVGHTTDSIPANQEAYNKLPLCCKYQDGAEVH